jgi:hypothetical protein
VEDTPESGLTVHGRLPRSTRRSRLELRTVSSSPSPHRRAGDIDQVVMSIPRLARRIGVSAEIAVPETVSILDAWLIGNLVARPLGSDVESRDR